MPLNSFQRFGIKHLSPSSINLARGSVGVWALKYIARMKDAGNPDMWRGTAVENGFDVLLHGGGMQAALSAAYQTYQLNVDEAGNPIHEDVEPQRALIAPMLEQLDQWKAPGLPNATQVKVEHYLDPVPVPFLGFVDFAFTEIDLDLKTTKAMPPNGEPRPDNRRQVSFYRKARGRRGALLYVTKAKHLFCEVTDDQMNEDVEDMRSVALALNNLLARCDTREDVLRSVVIDWDHYAAPKTKIPLEQILMGMRGDGNVLFT